MKKRLFLLVVCGVGLIFLLKNQKNTTSFSHPIKFYNQDIFFRATSEVENQQSETKSIIGAVTPHHLLASRLIADVFKRLNVSNPKTIILIGPNHYEKGEFPILTSLQSWQTPFGEVVPNKQIIEELLNTRLVKNNEEVLDNEHAIGGIVPFIKYYLPNSQVVPLILSGKMRFEDAHNLAKRLFKFIDDQTSVIASIDFSHYLPVNETEKKDIMTLESMRAFNYQKLMSFNNDYIDAPSVVTTLFLMMEKMGKKDFQILNHTNSTEFFPDDKMNTTSYFTLVFYH